MSEPTISVVVPIFNTASFLDTLLASLLAQTERSIEVIAVDDGSSDGSLEIVRRAAAADDRIRVVEQPNRGQSAARNAGIARARGRWIAFADSDDWLDPRTLRIWREHGERAGLEVVLGNAFELEQTAVERAGERRRLVSYARPEVVCSGADHIRDSVARGQWRHFCWLQLLRRDFVEAAGLRFEDGIVHEDVLWALRMGRAASRVGFVDEPLYAYRLRADSISHDVRPPAMAARGRGYLVVLEKFLAEAERCGDDRSLRDAILAHAHREARNFVGVLRDIGDEGLRRDLAREFVARRLWAAMLDRRASPRALWRALRHRWQIRRYAR